jgi:arylsulfatase A-like enzyme
VPPGGINDHGPIGILVMSGGAFKSGVRIPEQNVVDVTPTLLALLGMPIGEDMDGSVIEEAFAPGHLRSYPVKSIPTHEKS